MSYVRSPYLRFTEWIHRVSKTRWLVTVLAVLSIAVGGREGDLRGGVGRGAFGEGGGIEKGISVRNIGCSPLTQNFLKFRPEVKWKGPFRFGLTRKI